MDNNTLYVQFLGSFSVRWNGAEIFSDVKTGGTQMLCFLQMLLLDPEQGVARGQLVEELFYDRNLRNVTHSLNVLLYNLRQRLKAFDLPDCDYIEQRDGRYYWTEKIPVICDTEAFERLCRAAKACEDPEEGCRASLTACYQYTGEFLPMRTDSLWASHEARHYRELFHFAVVHDGDVHGMFPPGQFPIIISRSASLIPTNYPNIIAGYPRNPNMTCSGAAGNKDFLAGMRPDRIGQKTALHSLWRAGAFWEQLFRYSYSARI